MNLRLRLAALLAPAAVANLAAAAPPGVASPGVFLSYGPDLGAFVPLNQVCVDLGQSIPVNRVDAGSSSDTVSVWSGPNCSGSPQWLTSQKASFSVPRLVRSVGTCSGQRRTFCNAGLYGTFATGIGAGALAFGCSYYFRPLAELGVVASILASMKLNQTCKTCPQPMAAERPGFWKRGLLGPEESEATAGEMCRSEGFAAAAALRQAATAAPLDVADYLGVLDGIAGPGLESGDALAQRAKEEWMNLLRALDTDKNGKLDLEEMEPLSRLQ